MPVDAKTLIDWQTQMSNTAHQRQVADLKAAGLNPVLSAKLGGASTPSGAMDNFVAGSSSSGSGSFSTSGISSDGSIFGDLIAGLNPNGTTRIGKLNIPNWIIQGVYQKFFSDGEVPDLTTIATAVGDKIGASVTGSQLYNGVVNSTRSDVDKAALGVDAGTDGYVNPSYNGNSRYRSAQYEQSSTDVERFLGAVNPRLLDIYWHLTGQDQKRKRSEHRATS